MSVRDVGPFNPQCKILLVKSYGFVQVGDIKVISLGNMITLLHVLNPSARPHELAPDVVFFYHLTKKAKNERAEVDPRHTELGLE